MVVVMMMVGSKPFSAMGSVVQTWTLLSLILFPRILTPAYAFTVTYCSSDNTGSSSASHPSIFQSDGLCTETCANYAFAVLKGEGCWCSNVAPSNLVSNSECNSSCPGYPADLCGNDSKGLYGYYAIAGNSPTSTASGDGASITSTPTSSGSGSTSSGAPSGTSPVASVSSGTVSPSSSNSSDPSTSTTFATIGSSTTSTQPGVSIVTVSGQPTTIVVSNPESTSASASSNSSQHGGSILSGGAIAGIVIGSLIGAGLVIALLVWAWYLHNREYDKSPPTPESRYDPSVQNTTDNRRQSRASQMSLMPNANGQDAMRPGGPVTDYLSPSGLAFTDNRMKKDAALYPNGGRLSNVSLQDDQDYSRPVLRLTNPD